jgi:hypothetical protein
LFGQASLIVLDKILLPSIDNLPVALGLIVSKSTLGRVATKSREGTLNKNYDDMSYTSITLSHGLTAPLVKPATFFKYIPWQNHKCQMTSPQNSPTLTPSPTMPTMLPFSVDPFLALGPFAHHLLYDHHNKAPLKPTPTYLSRAHPAAQRALELALAIPTNILGTANKHFKTLTAHQQLPLSPTS